MTSSDIVIVGGGLVGLCAALALKRAHRSVTVLEASRLGPAGPGGLNARSIALSISSVQIFRALGLWPRLAGKAEPIRQIHVSSRGHWGVTRLRANDYELEALGYVIESSALGQVLLEAVSKCEQIDFIDEANFEAISRDERVHVEYLRHDRGYRHEAALALLADGADSSARAALGIDHRRIDYGQSAIVVNVEVESPREGLAFERFTTEGPLAMLPLGGKRHACVWTSSPARAAELAAMEEAQFCRQLQDCFGYRLGTIVRAGERITAALYRTRASKLRCGRCLLLGNAANALHPVAGQGFNLALRDIACLHELLAEFDSALPGNAELDELGGLYQLRRESEHRRVIGYGDGLVTLFSNPLPGFSHLRAAGLGALDLLPALKAQVAYSGMGLAFGGNRLLRGRS